MNLIIINFRIDTTNVGLTNYVTIIAEAFNIIITNSIVNIGHTLMVI